MMAIVVILTLLCTNLFSFFHQTVAVLSFTYMRKLTIQDHHQYE